MYNQQNNHSNFQLHFPGVAFDVFVITSVHTSEIALFAPPKNGQHFTVDDLIYYNLCDITCAHGGHAPVSQKLRCANIVVPS